MRIGPLLLLGLGACATAGPAVASDIADWNISPYTAELGPVGISLSATASGAAYATSGTGGLVGVTGSLLLAPKLEWQADNGWVLALHADLLAWHDQLSGGIYGGRVVEFAYATLQTPYGRIALGLEDGAAYSLSVTGPKVDDAVSLDAPQTVFFRELLTHGSALDEFRLVTGEFASGNVPKMSYYSPRLFGIAAGASYTPSQSGTGTYPLPDGASSPRQKNILEAAVNYERALDSFTFRSYAGFAEGTADRSVSGSSDLRDFGLGANGSYDFGDTSLATGLAYRHSDDYAFEPGEILPGEATHALDTSVTLARGAWIGGFEFANGEAGSAEGRPEEHLRGFAPSIAYVLNSNLQLTLGWQRLQLTPLAGHGTNASTTRDAVYLHLDFHV